MADFSSTFIPSGSLSVGTIYRVSNMQPTAHLRWNEGALEQLWQDMNGNEPNAWRRVPTSPAAGPQRG